MSMNVMQKLALLTSQANETDDQRAERLKQSAKGTGADPVTLYETETALRELGKRTVENHPETMDQFEQRVQSLAPMLGMDPEQAGEQLSPETFINLGTQYALRNPDSVARAVYTLHEQFRRSGLYDELGTEPLPAGAMNEPVDVEPEGDDGD